MDQDTFAATPDVFQEAYDLLPMGILIVNAAGSIVLVNRSVERMLGYERSELIGESIECLVPKRLEHSHRTARDDYTHHPATRPMGAGRELLARHRDGHEIPVEVGLSPLTRGSEHFVVSTIVDVTERRQLEEHVQQMQKEVAIGNLAAGIAHDFNNVLLGILGYAELAQTVVSGHEVTSHLAEIIQNTQRGRELVGRILNFARKKDPIRRAVAWDAIISDSLRLMRVSLPANVRIHVLSEPGVPSVLADPVELQQTFINLLTNAIHASSPRGGTIKVWLRAEPVDLELNSPQSEGGQDMCVCLSVIDEGSGMSRDVLEQVFKPFFTTKPPGKGTGLGLSVARQIVQSLGGAIEVESEEGHGTCVDVLLPAATQLSDEAQSNTGAPTVGRPTAAT